MKILSLSNCPLDHSLGSGRTRLAWANGLRALGHEVDTVESIELLGGSEGKPQGRRLRLAWGAWRWLRERDLTRYDLIEFFGAEFWLATWRLSARAKRPLLVAHTDGLELLAEERLRPLQAKSVAAEKAIKALVRRAVTTLKDPLEQVAFTRVDGFVTASNADRDYLLRRRLRQQATMEVVLLGLESAYHDLPRQTTRDERVVFLGSWIERKSIRSLIEVMARLMRTRPGLRLDLEGVGADEVSVLNDFSDDLRTRIRVRPRVTMFESIERLSNAKVFFLPSEYEGFGLALAEAMACGCAVVTTPTGFGADLRNEHEGLICGFGDTAAMETAIKRLLDDETLRDRVAEAGWQRAQGLRWDSSVQQLESIYLRWLADPARSKVARSDSALVDSLDRPAA